MIKPVFDDAPSNYMDPDRLQQLLGFENKFFFLKLLSNPFVREEFNRKVLTDLLPLPLLDETLVNIFRKFIYFSYDEFIIFCKKLSLIINFKSIMSIIHGDEIFKIINWCNDKYIIDFIRNNNFNSFSDFMVLSIFSMKNIDIFTLKIQSYLLGIFPETYLQHFYYCFSPEEVVLFQEPIRFSDDDQDRAIFINYILLLDAYNRKGRDTGHA